MLMCLVFIACSVFGIVSGFVLSCWTCMLVYVTTFIAGWVFSVAVVASNFLYFSRGWAVYR